MTATLDDDKAQDVVVIDLGGRSEMADYMVIATGASTRQVIAMTDHLLDTMKTAKVSGVTAEGASVGDWVLVDGGDVIVHLFRPEVRAFYDLEKMWATPATTADAAKTTRIGAATL